jgi:hypothetical protein
VLDGFFDLYSLVSGSYGETVSNAGVCMYLLTIRDGLVTRHIGPYQSPKQASDDLDRLLRQFGERARWQIHALEEPSSVIGSGASATSVPTAA